MSKQNPNHTCHRATITINVTDTVAPTIAQLPAASAITVVQHQVLYKQYN
jgi:hypothetical protein